MQCVNQGDSVGSYTKTIQYRWPTEGTLHSAHHVIAAVQALRDKVNNTPLIGLIYKGLHRVVPSKKSGILVSNMLRAEHSKHVGRGKNAQPQLPNPTQPDTSTAVQLNVRLGDS